MHARRSDHPILDLSLFRIPTFWHSVIGGSVFRLGIGATPFLLPLLLQLGFGMTPFQSGLITFATAVGAIVMKFTAPQIIRRYGFRTVLIVNTVLAAVFTAPAGHLHADDAGDADGEPAAHRRLLPLAAVHRRQCALLRRRAAARR